MGGSVEGSVGGSVEGSVGASVEGSVGAIVSCVVGGTVGSAVVETVVGSVVAAVVWRGAVSVPVSMTDALWLPHAVKDRQSAKIRNMLNVFLMICSSLIQTMPCRMGAEHFAGNHS